MRGIVLILNLVLLLLPFAAAEKDGDAAQISKLKVVDDSGELRIEITLTHPVNPQVTTATDPNRLILDLPNTSAEAKQRRIPLNQNGVKSLRLGLNSANPPVTRVVLDLDTARVYRTASVGNTITLTVLPTATAARIAKRKGAPAPAATGSLIGRLHRRRQSTVAAGVNTTRPERVAPSAAAPPTESPLGQLSAADATASSNASNSAPSAAHPDSGTQQQDTLSPNGTAPGAGNVSSEGGSIMSSQPQAPAAKFEAVPPAPPDSSSAATATTTAAAQATWTQPPAPTIRSGASSPALSSLQGQVRDSEGIGVGGARITLDAGADHRYWAISDGEGIFRLRNISPGNYILTVEKQGFQKLQREGLQVQRGAMLLTVLNIEAAGASETPLKGPAGVPGVAMSSMPEPPNTYPALPAATTAMETGTAPSEPESSEFENFKPQPSRWDLPLPEWTRYEKEQESPYTKGHWYDPFNRNRLKGDYPIFGQRWFFKFTGTSETGIDARRVPLPSGISTEQPGESTFFGKQEQLFLGQTFRLSFDLFRGDTSFRPVDFRLRFTPAVNLNFLQTRERGLVNIDVRKGINRVDAHAGLQEGFVEAKLHDLSPNFDIVSVRAGIQHFNSDFRGFLFSEEQPGLRIFGNLRSNRLSYNLAYFYMLEKDTNSGLNRFEPRFQQVCIANLYIQDFLTHGYNTQFSFHYNRDDATIHFDNNDFLVRPAPIGLVVNGGIKAHAIRAYYLGWTSNGHIGGINVSHAFYQALGHDSFNTIAGRYVNINAQLAALELSVDKDWTRFRVSTLYQSGDSANRSGIFRKDDTAHGFDTIVDDSRFAGSTFSFWDSEGIRLTRVGVALTNPGSLLASLRSNKFEGQANFVNPGVFLVNAGADFAVTPKLRAFVNGNYLRFVRTEPLEIVLMQRPIRHAIGTDLGAGIEYRPPLTENIVITAGTSYLLPATGFEQMLNGKTLISIFTRLKFEF